MARASRSPVAAAQAEAQPSVPQPVIALSEGRRWLAFSSLMLGFFTLLAAATSVNTALPVIQVDLHASLSQIEWFVDSYFITLTVLLTTFGRFGDLFGRKRMFLLGGVLFVAGSVASALSSDITFLIAFRALTAVGPAMMMPATLSLITDLFPPTQRGLPMGLWGSMVGVATGIGPTMGGFLVSDVGWRSVFWINVLLGLVTIALASVLLPPARHGGRRPSLDLPGVALNAGFILSLSYALVEGHDRGWTSPLIVGLFVAGVVLLVLFVTRELRAREPMLDLSLFRQPAFSAGIFVTLTISSGLLATFFFMPLFLQGPLHYSAIRSGLTLLPLSISVAVAGPFGGYLADRVQPYWPITAAMLLFTGGIYWLAHLSLSSTWQALIPPFVIVGLGLGMSSANINNAVMACVPSASAGAAAGVISTVRQLGSVLGVAVLGAILQNRQDELLSSYTHIHLPHAPALAFTNALNDTLAVCAAVLAAGALAATMVRKTSAAR